MCIVTFFRVRNDSNNVAVVTRISVLCPGKWLRHGLGAFPRRRIRENRRKASGTRQRAGAFAARKKSRRAPSVVFTHACMFTLPFAPGHRLGLLPGIRHFPHARIPANELTGVRVNGNETDREGIRAKKLLGLEPGSKYNESLRFPEKSCKKKKKLPETTLDQIQGPFSMVTNISEVEEFMANHFSFRGK